MSQRIGEVWGSIRGSLRDFSFAQIKDILGASGVKVERLAHLQQRFSGGASKGQLMDGVDELIVEMDPDQRDRCVVACIEEMLMRSESAREELDRVLRRVGWGIAGKSPFPLDLQPTIQTAELSDTVRESITTALNRYRDGDFDGAITSICGGVDSQTEAIYCAKNLGDHKIAAYHERVSCSLRAMEAEFRSRLITATMPINEQNLLWNNFRQSVGQAAHVLGTFRREYSDVHGAKDAPKHLVQCALDCAIFVLRAFSLVS